MGCLRLESSVTLEKNHLIVDSSPQRFGGRFQNKLPHCSSLKRRPPKWGIKACVFRGGTPVLTFSYSYVHTPLASGLRQLRGLTPPPHRAPRGGGRNFRREPPPLFLEADPPPAADQQVAVGLCAVLHGEYSAHFSPRFQVVLHQRIRARI